MSPTRVIRPTGGAGTLLVTDSGRNGLVEVSADARTELGRIGDGVRGLRDGDASTARFDGPQGLVGLPPAVAAAVGYDVVVADTGSHALRGVRRSDGAVRTVAAAAAGLRSPWDVAWWRDRVWVAMAGAHKLWTFDPLTGDAAVAAGTGREGLVDGPAHDVLFAQPSGLAADPDRDVLWLVDAESSALRVVEDSPAGLVVRTVVGRGLFTWGHRDGPARQALLQHPLGVRVDSDGAVLVADTYNGAVRRHDPGTDTVDTLATDLAEPSDLLHLAPGGDLLVVESAGPALTAVARRPQQVGVTDDSADGAGRAAVPVSLTAGRVRLTVAFTPPPGEQPDTAGGPPSRLVVTATPPALLLAGAGAGDGLIRDLHLAAAVGEGVLHISARAVSCELTGPDAGPHPACQLHCREWEVPVLLAAGTGDGAGVGELSLRLDATPTPRSD